jgi:hypothetical protein
VSYAWLRANGGECKGTADTAESSSSHKEKQAVTLPQLMSKARKLLGVIAFWAVWYVFMIGYPTELNKMLGISSILSGGDELNGPHDMTMLIRMVLALVVGIAAGVLVLKALGKLFPISVLATASSRKSTPIKQLK